MRCLRGRSPGSSWSDNVARSPISLTESPNLTRPSGPHEKAAMERAERLAVPSSEFFNGLGGFAEAGREYVTSLGSGPGHAGALDQNVIANPVFGFQVATEGSGFIRSVNSRENQPTPGVSE